jgi:hypothetical protein
MADSDINSDSPADLSESQQQQDDNAKRPSGLEQAWPVCPKCLTPCHPLASYCPNCDSNQPVNPLAAYMPFVNIRFNYGAFGIMWRKTCYDRKTPKVIKCMYLALMVLFTPIILVFGLPTLVTRGIRDPRRRNIATIALYALALMLLILLVLYTVLQPPTTTHAVP